ARRKARSNTMLVGELTAVHLQAARQVRVLQNTWMKRMRKPSNILGKLEDLCLESTQLPMQIQSPGRRWVSLQQAQPDPKSGEPLSNVVMQLSCDPATLFLLRSHHLAGKIAEFFLCPFLFGDIARRRAEP